MTANTVGARIKYWRLRRRGMTQEVLAGLIGKSQAYISQVERGVKAVDKRSTLVELARALDVTVADLLGQPGDPTDPLKADAADHIPAIWTALIAIEEGERRRPTWTPEVLDEAAKQVAQLRARLDCTGMARLLPDLLTEAAAHGGLALARVGYEASVCLRNLGHRPLALSAARLAVAAAQDADDSAWIGAARRIHVWALPMEAVGIANRAAHRTLPVLQAGAAAPDVRQMLGMLHLSMSLLSVTDGRPDDARAHLTEAHREAATLGDPADGLGFNEACFGPTNVGVWSMSIAAELGEYGHVVELARAVRPDVLPDAGRHQSYWMSLGRALAETKRDDREALVAFIRAERAAPGVFALNPLAHDAVLAMVQRARRRSISDDLRTLALRLGIEA